MPFRGRDSYYLELMIAACNISIGIICLLVSTEVYQFSVIDLFEWLAPIQLWCVLWLVEGVILGWGSLHHQRKMIRWGAFLASTTWGTTAYYALSNITLFPLPAALSPIFCISAGLIYHYQTRVQRKGDAYNGRFV